MGRALTDAVGIFAVVLVLIVLAAVALATRRYLLERSGGTVDCALRWPAGSGPWRLGVLAYQHDSLRWHGALGVLLRPEYVFHRRALSVISRRPAEPSETVTLGADRIVVSVAVKPDTPGSPDGEPVELAMTDQALTGFLAWLEASPPGSHLGDFSLVGFLKIKTQVRVAVGWGIASVITKDSRSMKDSHLISGKSSVITGRAPAGTGLFGHTRHVAGGGGTMDPSIFLGRTVFG